MYQFLYKYFILNKKISLPEIGNFYLNEIPAKIDFVAQNLKAPEQIVQFTRENLAVDQKIFYFLSEEMNISEVEAIRKLNDFSRQIKHTEKGKAIELPGLGILTKNNNDEFQFQSQVIAQKILPEISLNTPVITNAHLAELYGSGETKIIAQKAVPIPEEEKIQLKEQDDYWWVYAIILSIMGVGALLYYYM